MGKFRGIDSDPGWVQRRFRKIETEMMQIRAERRFRNTTIDPGTITNEALSDPVGGGVVSLSASAFAVPLAGAYVIDQAVSVPSGFNSVIVALTGRAYAVNTTAAADWLYARAEVYAKGATTAATALPVHAAATGSELLSVRLWVRTAVADWAADTDNTADLTGALTWFA